MSQGIIAFPAGQQSKGEEAELRPACTAEGVNWLLLQQAVPWWGKLPFTGVRCQRADVDGSWTPGK
jgi:hypothetical protein